MKYDEFRTNAKHELGRDNTTIDTLLDAWTNGVIRDAYRDLNLWIARQRWERDIIESKRSYPLPDLIATPDSFICLDDDGEAWWELPVRGEREMVQRYAPETTGTPKFAVVNKAAVDIWPMPDTTYVLRTIVKAFEGDLDQANASGQESALITEAYDFVFTGVMAKGFRYLKQYAASREWATDHQKARIELKRQNARRILSQEINVWPSAQGKGAEYRT